MPETHEKKMVDATTVAAHTHANAPAHATPAAAPAKKAEATEKKAPAKAAAKADEKKVSAAGKPEKKKGTKATWIKKDKVKKDDATKKEQDKLTGKWKPVFWGRFGKKNMRKRTNPKYDKWRKPRGIDILLRRDDGSLPQAGFRTPKAIRGLHPSGYNEVLVYSIKDMREMKPRFAARIAGTVGRKKRIEMIRVANEKKIPVLN